jgi:lipopolysaccharide transport protein LptA
LFLNKINILFFILIFCNYVYSQEVNEFKLNNIIVNSGSIEIEKKSNKIFFNNGVYVESNDFIIEANQAIFNKTNKVISVYGMPSKIQSTAKDNYFIGSADKIFFSQTDKIQLIGNATINYDDLSISSKEIIFNTRNGQVLSEN